MSGLSVPESHLRRHKLSLSIAAGAALIILAAFDLLAPIGRFLAQPIYGWTPFGDFVSYWAAHHILVRGGNPYDQSVLADLLRNTPWQAMPVFHPPWSLLLLSPLLAFPLYSALAVWFVVTVIGIISISQLAARLCSDGAGKFGLTAAPFAFSFLPVVLVVLLGQFGVILGLALGSGLWAWKLHRDLLAGLFLTFCLVKIHLLLPAGLAVLVFALRERRWRLFVVPGVALSLLIAGLLLCNPDALVWWASSHQNAYAWATANFATAVRLIYPSLLDSQMLAWSFDLGAAALIIGLVTVKKEELTSPQNITMLLCISLTCAPYAWLFDFSLLLLPYNFLIIAIRNQRRTWRAAVGAVVLAGFSISCFALRTILPFDYQWFWFGPAFAFFWYLLYIFTRNGADRRCIGPEGSPTNLA